MKTIHSLIEELERLEKEAEKAPWKAEFDRCEPVSDWGHEVLDEAWDAGDTEDERNHPKVRKAIESGDVVSYHYIETLEIPEVDSCNAELICLLRNNAPLLLAMAKEAIDTLRPALEMYAKMENDQKAFLKGFAAKKNEVDSNGIANKALASFDKALLPYLSE